MSIIKVCRGTDVPEGEAKRFVDPKFDVAVYNINGKLYVTDDTCTHGPSSLADGFIEGETVECPFHHGAFHIPTGQPTKFPCTVALRTYTTQVINGELFIEIE